jgi:hypothetical protein
MDIFEVKQKETVSRDEVAARLRLLADMLSRNNDLEFDRGGMHFTVRVPISSSSRLSSRWRSTSASSRSS